MNRHVRYLMVAASVCLLSTGCPNPGPGGQDGGTDGGGDDMAVTGNFIRVHYSVAGSNVGSLNNWALYWFGAGSTSPPDFNAPPAFNQTDTFGVYRDIPITDTNGFLGLIPQLGPCTSSGCVRRDVQTEVRYADLPAVSGAPNIHEAWIVQGRVVATSRPDLSIPQYRITRPSEFIDLGDGRVRLTFRVAPGSTGTVSYGTSQGTLNQQVTWTATSDINKNGLLLTGLTAGTTYYYRINTSLVAGGQTRTDQSAVLSLTPISFSTVTDAADWASWGSNSLMYQVFVRTFADGGATRTVTNGTTQSGIDPASRDGIGDLVGLRNTLPYLRDLGVDAIWMTPVFRARSYHGYDTTDFYDIDPSVGTIRDFVDLAEAAHALNPPIRIIVDFVINHVADVNPWFTAALNPSDPEYNTYRDWFVYSDDYENILTDRHPFDASQVIWACRNYRCYHEIFGSGIPELNFRNPAVRTKMKDIAQFWLQRGADGFRLDASKHIDQFDENNTVAYAQHGTHVWWKEFNYYVKKQATRPASAAGLGQVILAGENRYDALNEANLMIPYAGDMDSQFDFPFRTSLNALLTGQTNSDADFISYLNQIQVQSSLPTNNGNANHYYQRFLSNHDLDRPASQYQANLLRLAATVVFTVPGMPVIYYGEEFGKQGKRDLFNGIGGYPRDEFIREPMSWLQNLTFTGNQTTSYDIDFNATNAANASVLQDPLLGGSTSGAGIGVATAPNPDYRFIKFMAASDANSWAAQRNDTNSLYNYYKRLVTVRKANPLLTDPTATRATVTNSATLFEFRVTQGTQSLSVVLNRTANAQTVTRLTSSTDLLTSTQGTSFSLPAYGALILQ